MILAPFIAPELIVDIDLPTTQKRLASIVKSAVLPRLFQTHTRPFAMEAVEPKQLATGDIEKLAHLVLDPSIHLSSDFIDKLEAEGHSIDDLFVHLLEPAARCLGTMWDNDECSFIDVTLGMARLQQLLAMFSRSHAVPDFSRKRNVCMVTLAMSSIHSAPRWSKPSSGLAAGPSARCMGPHLGRSRTLSLPNGSPSPD